MLWRYADIKSFCASNNNDPSATYELPLLAGTNFPLRPLQPNRAWGWVARTGARVTDPISFSRGAHDFHEVKESSNVPPPPKEAKARPPSNPPTIVVNPSAPPPERSIAQRSCGACNAGLRNHSCYKGSRKQKQEVKELSDSAPDEPSASSRWAEFPFEDDRWKGRVNHHRGRSRFVQRKRDSSADRARKLERSLSRFMQTADYRRD